jgi:hypothetical protein
MMMMMMMLVEREGTVLEKLKVCRERVLWKGQTLNAEAL